MCCIVLVSYVNRSGSSFFFEQVSKSPYVVACLEAEVLIYELLLNPHKRISSKIIRNIIGWLKTDPKLSSWNLTKDDLKGINTTDYCIEAFIKILKCYARKVKPKADTIFFKGTKLIDVFIDCEDVIKENGFNSLCIIRDPRAVFNSQKKSVSSISNKPFSSNPLSFAYEWETFVRKTLYLKKKGNIILLMYEEIVSNPQSVIEKLSGILPSTSFVKTDKGDYFSRLPIAQVHLHENIIDEPNVKRLTAWEYELDKTDIFIVNKLTKHHRKELSFSDRILNATVKDIFFTTLYFFCHYIMSLIYVLEKVRYKLLDFLSRIQNGI